MLINIIVRVHKANIEMNWFMYIFYSPPERQADYSTLEAPTAFEYSRRINNNHCKIYTAAHYYLCAY